MGENMFVYSLKWSKIKWIFGLTFVVLILVFGTLYFVSAKGDNMQTSTNVVVQSNEQRLEYLKSFGWEVTEDPVTVKDVVIPETFNEVYEQYNIIQKKQGFDLSQYKGKTVKIWTYQIVNYPDHPDYVYTNIYTLDDKVIAGDVCNVQSEEGFMHGFAMTE